MKRRILSIITALALCLSLCPTWAFAAEGAATVEINGTATSYSTFKEAWNAANSGGRAVLTLHQNVDVLREMGSSTLFVDAGSDIELRGGSYTITSNFNSCTIQVNGKFTLTDGTVENTSSDGTPSALYVRNSATSAINGGTVRGRTGVAIESGSLTVTGGNVSGSARGIDIMGGSANISGGNISASAGDGVYVSGNATLRMNSGDVYGSDSGIKVHRTGPSDNSIAVLSGGKVSGGKRAIAAIDYYNRIFASSFLAADCAYYDESGDLIDYPETSDLNGTVTIGVCDHSSTSWEKDDTEHRSTCRGCKKQFPSAPHSFTEVKDLGNGTHQSFCECGMAQEAAGHEYDSWSDENGSHVRACTVCGAVERGTHNFSGWQDNGDGTHTGTCPVCQLTKTEGHSVWRSDNDNFDGTHTRSCICGIQETKPHNWNWTVIGPNGHRGTCSDCGVEKYGNHQIAGYSQWDQYEHFINCAVCGKKAFSSPHRYAEDGSWTDVGDVHAQICLDCGYEKSENHTYTDGSYQPDGEEGHFRVCTICGHKSSGEHFATSAWQQADDGHYRQCTLCKWQTEWAEHTYRNWTSNGAENHSSACSVCRYKQTQPHDWDENQRCKVCGYSEGEVAVVSIDGSEDQIFTELTDAWSYAAGNSSPDKPATVRLLLNTEISQSLEVKANQNIILEMADEVTLTRNGRVIYITGGNFTLNSGKINAKSENGIYVSGGGTAHINGGEVVAEKVGVYGYGTGTQVFITGGSFSGGSAAVQLDWATTKITITGGTFSSTSGNGTVFRGYNDTNACVNTMIAEGYSVYDVDGTRVSSDALAVLLLKGGPYTVGPCEHNYEYEHTDGTTTHSQVCTLCGVTENPENCTFTDGACVCGAKLAVALNGAEGLTYTGAEQKPGVTVTVDGQTLAADQYSVNYADNINFGTATVTISSTNFSGEVQKTFSIGKAGLTIKAKDQTISYGQSIGEGVDYMTVTGLCTGDHLQSVTLAASGAVITPSGAQIQNASGENVTGNYEITYQTGTLTVQKSKPEITFKSGYNPSKTYDGQTIANPTAEQLTITGAAYGDVTFTWSATPKDAGAYTLTASIEESASMEAASATLNVTINKAPLSITGATVAPKTYDTTTTATVTGVTFSGLVNGETLTAADYTVTGEFENANAGVNKSVSVTVTLSNTTKANNYSLSGVTLPATGEIRKADSSITTPPTATGITYGQALSASTLSGGAASVAGTWAWTDGTTKPNAGTPQHEVTFTPTDTNYSTVTTNVSVAVAKATPTITWGNSSQTVNYTGEAAKITAPTVTLVNGESFSGTISYSYSSNNSDYASGLPTNAGTYKVKASVGEQSNYIAATSAEMMLTISKVNYTGTTAASTSGMYGMTKTYELKDLLPEGFTLGTVSVSDGNSIFDGTPSVSGTTLTYKLAGNQDNAGKTGTITIPVTGSTNYNAFELTITVTVTKVRVPTLTVNPIRMTYTGSPVPNDRISGTATIDGKEIKGRWSFVSGQALTNVADSGTKNVTFTPEDTTEYGPNTGTVVVTITKATPTLTLTPSPATLPNGGTVTLTLSGLPAGGSADVTCSNGSISVTKGSGNTWTAELPAGGGSYAFTASYPGDGNHTGATANCTVSVEKVTPTLALSATPENLSGGGTVTLTLTGLPAGGTATINCSDSSITVTAGAGNTWTATLPNSTATYTFTASYAGNDSYHPASASRIVTVQEVIILPDPPAGDGDTHYQVVMKPGISEVPEGLKNIPELNTPEKLELAMKLAITQLNTGISQANTAVYDVTLMVSKDGGTTWDKATADNFPADGLRVTLPYPSGTDSSYQFTVVHMFTTTDFGKTPGKTEAPKVSNTSKGIQFVVTGLSPISVGWTKASTPTNPTGPTDGGGSYVSTYAVTVEKSEHGKVTSNRNNAASGTTVTLTVTPDSGYVLDTLTVTDSRGNEIKLTAQNNGKYTFTMPSRAVTVKATFVPLPDGGDKPCDGGADCPSRGFTDLGTVGTWYHEAVDYVLCNGLMGGYSSTMFGPNDNLTRAQFAQILFNKEGRPVVNYLLQYNDVAAGAWYTEAIRWATSQGVVGGYGNGRFGPNDNITREQLAVMLWRYAGSPAATNKELHFADVDKISGYALEALRWAVENGILNGYGDGRLGPDGLATRAQVAQMLKNFLENQ